jgi:hypothetical protein
MPDSTEKQNLAQWFSDLHTMQDACAAIKTGTATLDLLKFANTTITSVLPSANEQGQFELNVKASLGIDVTAGHIAKYSTFEALLDHFSSIAGAVSDYLQTLSAAPFPTGGSADFNSAKVSSAFPGGSTGQQWTNADGLLACVIPPVCFSSTLRAAVAKTVDSSTKLVSDLVNQIAVLG